MTDFADTTSEPVQGLAGPIVEMELFSLVGHNLWQGGVPTAMIPYGIEYVVNLYPWTEYGLPEGVTLTRAWLEDIHEMPPIAQIVALGRWVAACRKIAPTLVHCQAGLNRSGLVCALALMVDGASPEEAITKLRNARSEFVLCNATFEAWLREEAAEALRLF